MSSGLVLVTGGAGYIGSHCALALLEAGRDIVIFDNLELGHIETVDALRETSGTTKGKLVGFIQGDLNNRDEIGKVLADNKGITAVLHFAAYSQVAESVRDPGKYYRNNIGGTLNLLDAMRSHGINKIVFSSTAATYGEPQYTPIDEGHPQVPVNPYGKSKLMVETIMDDYGRAYGIKSVRLRYFNAAGADGQARIGEWHEPETHLIPNILKAAGNSQKVFLLYGTDYETRDGTCVRDYIHVEDLASAHLKALEYLEAGQGTIAFNLGTNDGSTVREVFAVCEQVTGQKIPVEEKGRRAGDPAVLIADNAKAKASLNWMPEKTLAQAVQSAWAWERAKNIVDQSKKQQSASSPVIPIVFAVDDNYAPVLAVALQSLVEYASVGNTYRIYILNEGLSRLSRWLLEDVVAGHSNISLEFTDVSPLLDEATKAKCYIEIHATLATYYRFFIGRLFQQYPKVLYLDADIILNRDVAELYLTDIGDSWIGAVRDVRETIATTKGLIVSGRNWKDYVSKVLGLADPYTYFQAGVLLINTKAFLDNSLEEKCFEVLQRIGKPILSDQDVLNSVCQGHINYLPIAWNVQWQIPFEFGDYASAMSKGLFEGYVVAREDPAIIHYASSRKPWTDSKLPQAEVWWRYAKKAGLQDILKAREMQSLAKRYLPSHLEERITHYQRMSSVTFGATRKRYLCKCRDVQDARDVLLQISQS